jgi:hypothetical protein
MLHPIYSLHVLNKNNIEFTEIERRNTARVCVLDNPFDGGQVFIFNCVFTYREENSRPIIKTVKSGN